MLNTAANGSGFLFILMREIMSIIIYKIVQILGEIFGCGVVELAFQTFCGLPKTWMFDIFCWGRFELGLILLDRLKIDLKPIIMNFDVWIVRGEYFENWIDDLNVDYIWYSFGK